LGFILLQYVFETRTKELENFTPEWTLYVFQVSSRPATDGTRQSNFAILDKKIALIGGTGYTGEMKKGIFSALNFILPVNKIHYLCTVVNVGDKDDTAISLVYLEPENFINRSKRKLIGDDEHGWTSENTVLILKADATLR
jgi:phosphoenolpyruvate carboxykinase (ATP)